MRSTMTVAFGFLFFVSIFPSDSIAQRRGNDLPLFYNVTNGNVTIDLTEIHGGTGIGYAIANEARKLIPAGHTPFTGSFFSNSTDYLIAESQFAGFDAGVYSLGNIFPPGLSEEELLMTYFEGEGTIESPDQHFYALGKLGSGVQHVFAPVYSPSPFPAINADSDAEPKQWATQAELSYDPNRGSLTLGTNRENGGSIWSYRIVLTDDVLAVDEFIPTRTEIPPSTTQRSVTEIGLGGIDAGSYFLGDILPAGLTQSELVALIFSARFVGEPGHNPGGLNLDTSGVEFSLAFVPEPSSFLPLAVYLLGVFFFKRRSVRE